MDTILETGQTCSTALSGYSIDSILEFGAGEGIRTLDPNLGKVVLYP